MKLSLVDNSPDVAESLRRAFLDYPEVVVAEGDILTVARCALVSPANSYGYMDGGIDRLYVAKLGADLQRRVLEAIDRESNGYVPVGSAVLVTTGNATIP